MGASSEGDEDDDDAATMAMRAGGERRGLTRRLCGAAHTPRTAPSRDENEAGFLLIFIIRRIDFDSPAPSTTPRPALVRTPLR
jgi:hypothetical protein